MLLLDAALKIEEGFEINECAPRGEHAGVFILTHLRYSFSIIKVGNHDIQLGKSRHVHE
jgi:hypothetical protein